MENHSEASEELIKKIKEMGDQTISEAGIPNFTPITCFTSLFAEWVVQGGHLLVHLFPRLGADDRWFDGQVIKGKYWAARREQKADGVDFPKNMPDLIKQSANAIWHGDAQLDFVEELGAYAVRFVDVSALQMEDIAKEGGFMDRFVTFIDNALDN